MTSYINNLDQWYSEYIRLTDEEQLEKVKAVLDEEPNEEKLIEFDFGTVVIELAELLIDIKKYDLALSLIDKVRLAAPALYKEEFPYLNHFAVKYYIFKQDWDKVEFYLEPFVAHPDHGLDMLIPQFRTIQYYQQNDLALDLARKLYKPVKESEHLIGGAEIDFADMLLYHTYQEHLLLLDKGQTPALRELENALQIIDLKSEYMEQEFPKIHHILSKIAEIKDNVSLYTKEEWLASSNENLTQALRDLSWYFAAYMLREKQISFHVSQDFWFFFTQLVIENKAQSDFHLQRRAIEKTWRVLYNDEAQLFAFIWGLPYIYDFLQQQQLVELAVKDEVLAQVSEIKQNQIQLFQNELWQLAFIHTWGEPDAISDEEFKEEQALFQDSFTAELKEIEILDDTSFTSSFAPNFGRHTLPQYDDLFGGSNVGSRSDAKQKAKKKKKNKEAKKQRKKNRKK